MSRNWLAWKLASWALRLATKEYRTALFGSIEYGMRSAARDVQENRTPPPDWRNE